MLSAETPSTRYDFTYYENGLRKTKQCVQGYRSYEYIYDGTTLVTENFIGLYTLVYIYDVNGAPIGFKYRANNYATDTWDVFWYEKNLLGDIVAVYSATGTKLVSYDYDAWGNFTTTYHNGGASTGAMYNKFTYRGYYYDSDLGLYYLQSRYYDPVICRFISPDYPDVITATPTALTDKNLFAYCDNNPVMRGDHDGMFWGTVFDVFSLGMSVVEVWANPYDPWAWAGLIGDAIDLLPIVSGVGEATDVLRIATKADDIIDIADDIHDTTNIVDGTIDTYKNLRKVNKGNGLEVHHIVEKRFVKKLDVKERDMLSIALTHDEHVVFTREWRQAIPYKTPYDRDKIWLAAQDIYKKHPRLLEAARITLGR